MSEVRFSDVRIATVPAMRVACFRVASPTPEDDAAAHARQWLAAHGLTATRFFGFDVAVPPEQARHDVRGYEVWAVLPPDAPAGTGAPIRDVPGGLYAVLTVFDAFDDPFKWIPEGWKRLQRWVGRSAEYRAAEHQWLEEIVTDGRRRHLAAYFPVTAAWVESAA